MTASSWTTSQGVEFIGFKDFDDNSPNPDFGTLAPREFDYDVTTYKVFSVVVYSATLRFELGGSQAVSDLNALKLYVGDGIAETFADATKAGVLATWPTAVASLEEGETYIVGIEPNRAPVIGGANPVALTVPENTASGTDIGTAFSATDADVDTIAWYLDGTDVDLFTVDPDGQVATAVILNHEDAASRTFQVVADDGRGGTDNVTVNVTVNDDNTEVPGKPDAPTNAGPPITGYGVRYCDPANSADAANPCDSDTAADWTAHSHTGTDTTTTISGLAEKTGYHAQVRATNAEGAGEWSASGAGSTAAPGAPEDLTLTGGNAKIDVDWTAPANDGGSAITGYDVEYCLSSTGCDAASEWTDAGHTGTDTNDEITELTNGEEYQVRVRAKNAYAHSGWAEAAVRVINGCVSSDIWCGVLDAEASPGQSNPRNGYQASNNFGSLAPLSFTYDGSIYKFNTAISSSAYLLLGFEQDPTPLKQLTFHNDADLYSFTTASINTNSKTASWFAGANAFADGESYVLRISTTFVDSLPEFPTSGNDGVTLIVNSTYTSGHQYKSANGGDPPLSYTLSPDISGIGLSLNSSTRGISGTTHTSQPKTFYTYTVTDADGDQDTDQVWIAIKPAQPENLSAAAGYAQATPTWTKPADTGITGWQVTQDDESTWSALTFSEDTSVTPATLSATIGSLTNGTTYTLKVRAVTGSGSGLLGGVPSAALTVTPFSNPPVIGVSDPVAITVPENTASGTNIGDAFTATDPDRDTITWSLGGTDAGLFAISSGGISSGGQLSTNAVLNHEDSASRTFTVIASDGQGGTDSVTVNVTVTDVTEPPGKPAAPTVTGASGSRLSVSWSPPTNTEPAISGYGVRYREGNSGGWTSLDHTGTATAATISGLKAATSYQVQVRATNAEGDGAWSDSGTGSTALAVYFYPTSGDLVSGGVVRSRAEGCRNDDWIWDCLDDAIPDGDGSMLTLVEEGVITLGFTVASGDVPGTVTAVWFEASMAANTKTMAAGAYGFTVFAGSDQVAAVSGPQTVGENYATVMVEGANITSGLSGKLDEAEIHVEAPASPYMRLTRVRMVVEYEP